MRLTEIASERIVSHLRAIERAEGVRVLFAVEAGSRAWGFASRDSDYDVRFVYARSIADYLRLEKQRDTIERACEGNLDVAGWDLRKFLQLVRSSNPSAFEWLGSPTIYSEIPAFENVRRIAARCFSPVASAHHYLEMAASNAPDDDGEQATLKRYLYAVRATLAARWSVDERSPAPVPSKKLASRKLPANLRETVDRMVKAKRRGNEVDACERFADIDEWLASEAEALNDAVRSMEAPGRVPWKTLDEAFLGIVFKR